METANKIKVTNYVCNNCRTIVGEKDLFCRMCGVRFVNNEENTVKESNEVNCNQSSSLSPLVDK
mgnify:CR=1 FL=1